MSDIQNPWVSQAASQPEPTDVANEVSADPSRTGPLAPQAGVPVPDQGLQLPVVPVNGWAGLWFVGAHGGSGESTLTSLVPGAAAAGHAWPAAAGRMAPVALVARSNVRGLRAAQAAAQQWAAGLVPSVELLGLVVMSDAPGKLPRELRDLVKVVAGGVPRLWEIPWVPSWRTEEVPTVTAAQRQAQRTLTELTYLANNPS